MVARAPGAGATPANEPTPQAIVAAKPPAA
jgi:hypothetical protein